MELETLFMPMWLDLTTVPVRSNARLPRVELGPFSLIVLVVLPSSPTSPPSVPNSSPVPLCNVLWGLGVCPVLFRSISPCRLVLEVRLFPSPACAVLSFCPSFVSAFFFLLPFRVVPAPAGCVCVCVTPK